MTFLVVNDRRISDKWSNDGISTCLHCPKSTKCYGMLKVISIRTETREMKEFKKWLDELNIVELTADCVPRNINVVKTVYSQEVTKIMKSKKSGAESDGFYGTSQNQCGLTLAGHLLHKRAHTTLDSPDLVSLPHQTDFSSPIFPSKVDISVNRTATITLPPWRITSVDAILLFTGSEGICLNANISLNSCFWNSYDLHWFKLTSVNQP